jgi:DNA-binding NtrC family response regulator
MARQYPRTAKPHQALRDPGIGTSEVIELKKVTQKATKHLERMIMLRVLDAHGWHRRSSARALSISYGALLYKMREAGLPVKKRKEGRSDVAALDAGNIELQDAERWDSPPFKRN